MIWMMPNCCFLSRSNDNHDDDPDDFDIGETIFAFVRRILFAVFGNKFSSPAASLSRLDDNHDDDYDDDGDADDLVCFVVSEF